LLLQWSRFARYWQRSRRWGNSFSAGITARRDEAIRNGMKLLWSPLYASIAAPNSSGQHTTAEYSVSLRSNSEGFREQEFGKGEDLDVAILGDSYVWGTGAEQEWRFTNLLQARFAGLTVGNHGLCTAGTLNELAIYRDFVRT